MEVYIKRIQDIKDSEYDYDSYIKAIESQRIQELLKKGLLKCELRCCKDECFINNRDIYNFCTINIEKTCCSILEILDDKIKVKIDDTPMGNILQKMYEDNKDNIFASMRTLSKSIKCSSGEVKYYIDKLVTFDIIYDGD